MTEEVFTPLITPTGRHAFIGLGFNDRSYAFDFNAAINDYQTRLEREQNAGELLAKPASEQLTLPDGQSIRINLKTKSVRIMA